MLLSKISQLDGGRGAVTAADDPEEGQAEEDERGSDQRALEVAGVTPDQDGCGADDEDGRQQWITPYAVGAV